MATSDILGLFMSPEQYQAQQMAQQQAAEQQRAFNFAQLSPRDQAVYGMFLGGQQLARGIGGLLGVQDPQLQRIRQREEIMRSINPADMDSLTAGIQRASQMGDSELALSLTDFMRKQGSEIELARQRKAAAERERVQSQSGGIQEAARIAEIERTLVGLPKDSTEYLALTAEKARLQKSAKAAGLTEKQREAAAYADTVSDNPDSPEWKEAYKNRLDRLQLGKEGAVNYGPDAQKLIDAGYIPGSPAFVSKMDEIIAKGLREKEAKDTYGPDAQKLIDAGYIPGSPAFVSKMDQIIAKGLREPEDKDQIVQIGETVAPNKEGLPAGLKVYSNKTNKTQYILRDGQEVPYYGSVEPQGKTTVNVNTAVSMPTKAEDIVEYEGKLRETVKNELKTVNFVESAIANLNLAQLSNNASAFNAARMQLARSLGDSQISKADVENAGGDPAVYARLRDMASNMIRGRPDDPTIDDIRRTLKALARVAARQGNATLARQRRLAESAKDKKTGARTYTDEQINLLFDFPQFNKYAGQNAPSAGGGDKSQKPAGGKTVPFNALPK